MKYCKKCGVLYSGLLVQCPKCNTALEEYQEPAAPEAPKEVKTRQWIAICIGIPALIGFMYLMASILARLS